jgi:hypothetical protein
MPTRKRSKVGEHPFAGYPGHPTAEDRKRLYEAIDLIFDEGEQYPEPVRNLKSCVSPLAKGEVHSREHVRAEVDRILNQTDIGRIAKLYRRVADIQKGGLGLPEPVRPLSKRMRQHRAMRPTHK